MADVPHYVAIKREIARQIRNKQLLPNDLLPGRWALTEKFGCSWATVNRAIQELILEGTLYASKGKGTFVSTVPAGQDLRPGTISVLLCNARDSVYYSVQAMMEGIRMAAGAEGYAVQFIDLQDYNRFRDLDQWIVITPALSDFPLLEEALHRGDRFVVLGAELTFPEARWVNSDTREGTRRAVGHLLECGHRHILMFGVQRNLSNYEQKVKGYVDALVEAGLPPDPDWIVYRPESQGEVAGVLANWLEGHPECTAIYAADYTSGLAVLGWAIDNGVSIPEDLSLFVMGEVPSSPYLRVPLSSVVQPFTEMGQQAVRLLLTDEEAAFASLPCKLIYRNSVLPARSNPINQEK
ncbi:substrate-binding domain-containing protein [Paenibacillus solisilvae]|uniref:Substrate-binding domain-containing protein n=1 Tax=Paenibacillus solisilvae TaxID=2486751 RepID=A0ABW0VV25_9BACL